MYTWNTCVIGSWAMRRLLQQAERRGAADNVLITLLKTPVRSSTPSLPSYDATSPMRCRLVLSHVA